MGIRFDGLSTGLDTTALINSLITLERRPLVQLQNRQAGLENERSLFQDLNTRLLALRDAVNAIDNQNSVLNEASLDEEFLAYAASSDGESFVTATADGNATPGAVEIHVDELARGAREFTNGFTSDSDIIATQGQILQVDFGPIQQILISVPAGGASLNDLRDLINTAGNNQGEVRADVVFDGTAHRLTIAGTQTGVENDISIVTNIPGPGANPFVDTSLSQAASDASFVAFGLPVTRPGNTVTDVLPGVTLELHAAHAAAEEITTIDVQRDDAAIEEKLQTFVDTYNDVRDFTIAQASFNPLTGTAGTLSGDYTVRNIDIDFPKLLSTDYKGTNPFSYMSDLGIRFDRDGRLQLDSAVLNEALDQDPIAVRELLSGDGTNDGFATALSERLAPLTQSGEGVLAVREDGLDDRIEALQTTIERVERRIEQREELLVRQFARLETLVNQLQSQGDFLASAFSFQNGQR